MAKRLYTEKEVETLRRLSKTHTAKQISEILNRPVGSIHMKLYQMGLKGYDCRCISRLTDQQIYWFKKNFPHVSTIVCATILGISPRSVVRLARRFFLEKTPQLMKETQAHAAKKAKESHLRNGTYPPKGVLNENLKKGKPYRFKGKEEIVRQIIYGTTKETDRDKPRVSF